MSWVFKLRRDTAAEWASENPRLAAGEPGVELDTGKFKIGDGVRSWADLPYFLDQQDFTPIIQAMIAAAVIEGVPGPEGDSAYAVAVNNGFVGTESQWLASLVGPKGDTGAQGAQGLQGPQGIPGDTGPEGPQGDEGPQGIEGPQGPAGADGADGTDGADGESVVVTLVPASSWPPAPDSNPLHLYFRVPDA